MRYKLNLPFAPSINGYYGIKAVGSRSIKYIKEKGRDYRKQVLDYITTNNLDLKANIPLKLSVILTPPDNRVRDIDNNLKCLFDSLTLANFLEDDRHIRELHIYFDPVNKELKQGQITVYAEPLTDDSTERPTYTTEE